MAITKEQAVLELLLEIGDLVKDFNTVERQWNDTIAKLRSATDKADIDQLSREAKESRDAMARLADQGNQHLRKLAAAGQIATNEYKELSANVRRLEASIESADRELEQFNRGSLNRLREGGERLRATWLAVAAAFAAAVAGLRLVGGFVRRAIAEADAQAAAEAQVKAAIESTGGAAGVTAEELGKMASELQGVTTVADDTISGVQSLLLTFTSLRKEELPEITERVLDVATAMAAARGGTADFGAATIQVGKALNDPLKGMSALTKAGIQLSEQQQREIKNLVEQNRLYDAQRIILDELATQFGGRARASVNTFGGALDQAKNSASDLLEVVGQQGLNKELTALLRLFTETSGSLTPVAAAIGKVLAVIVSGVGLFVFSLYRMRAAVSDVFAFILRQAHGWASLINNAFEVLERGVLGAVERIVKLIPDIDIPGKVDDALRAARDSVLSGLDGLRSASKEGREGILAELKKLAQDFKEVAVIDETTAQTVVDRLVRIRAEIEAAGAAAAGPLAEGVEDAAAELAAFRDQLFGNADALRLHSQRLLESVESIGGLAKATPAQIQVITVEVQKLLDDFEKVGERPPAALEALARSMGITATSIKADAEGAAAAIKGLVEAAEEASRVPATRFSADLDLDPEAIRGRLAQVQAELEGLRGGFQTDPGREFELLEEESRLRVDLTRAERAWQDVIVDTNRARGVSADLSQEHIDLLRQEGLLTEGLAEGLGLTAEQLERANVRFAAAGDQLGGIVDSGTEAAQVTLPALDESLLDSARSSGALDESLKAISDELLVTAGHADDAGEGLATAGEKGAAAAKKAAEESKTAAEKIKEQVEAVNALVRALETLEETQERVLKAGSEQWRLYAAEIRGAVEACSALRECQGGG